MDQNSFQDLQKQLTIFTKAISFKSPACIIAQAIQFGLIYSNCDNANFKLLLNGEQQNIINSSLKYISNYKKRRQINIFNEKLIESLFQYSDDEEISEGFDENLSSQSFEKETQNSINDISLMNKTKTTNVPIHDCPKAKELKKKLDFRDSQVIILEEQIQKRNEHISILTRDSIKDILFLKEQLCRQNQPDFEYYEVQYFNPSDIQDDNTRNLVNIRMQMIKKTFEDKTNKLSLQLTKLISQNSILQAENFKLQEQIRELPSLQTYMQKIKQKEKNPYIIWKAIEESFGSQFFLIVLTEQIGSYGINYPEINKVIADQIKSIQNNTEIVITSLRQEINSKILEIDEIKYRRNHEIQQLHQYYENSIKNIIYNRSNPEDENEEKKFTDDQVNIVVEEKTKVLQLQLQQMQENEQFFIEKIKQTKSDQQEAMRQNEISKNTNDLFTNTFEQIVQVVNKKISKQEEQQQFNEGTTNKILEEISDMKSEEMEMIIDSIAQHSFIHNIQKWMIAQQRQFDNKLIQTFFTGKNIGTQISDIAEYVEKSQQIIQSKRSLEIEQNAILSRKESITKSIEFENENEDRIINQSSNKQINIIDEQQKFDIQQKQKEEQKESISKKQGKFKSIIHEELNNKKSIQKQQYETIQHQKTDTIQSSHHFYLTHNNTTNPSIQSFHNNDNSMQLPSLYQTTTLPQSDNQLNQSNQVYMNQVYSNQQNMQSNHYNTRYSNHNVTLNNQTVQIPQFFCEIDPSQPIQGLHVKGHPLKQLSSTLSPQASIQQHPLSFRRRISKTIQTDQDFDQNNFNKNQKFLKTQIGMYENEKLSEEEEKQWIETMELLYMIEKNQLEKSEREKIEWKINEHIKKMEKLNKFSDRSNYHFNPKLGQLLIRQKIDQMIKSNGDLELNNIKQEVVKKRVYKFGKKHQSKDYKKCFRLQQFDQYGFNEHLNLPNITGHLNIPFVNL